MTDLDSKTAASPRRYRAFLPIRRLLPISAMLLLAGCTESILHPKGQIGSDERWIILVAAGLMLVIVIPVIVTAIAFAWRYRASNENAAYAPDWANSRSIEAAVWFAPCAIVAVLGTLAWISSHRLDPYRPIASADQPIAIEVVALDWKWLFIYPDLNIATVNEIAFPVDVPVEFRVTSGTVMNSFFIPALGSQIYAMAGMETRLNLIADQIGSYNGISANYSGAGFSDMKFKALAMTRANFASWVAELRRSGPSLDCATYGRLAAHSRADSVLYFSSVDPRLFDEILDNPSSTSGAWCARMSDNGS